MVDLKELKRAPARRGKGAPPPAGDAEENLTKPASGDKVPLQLKISPELRREFKGYALERDINASVLFVQVWDYFKERHG